MLASRLVGSVLVVAAQCLAAAGCALLSPPATTVVQRALINEVPRDPPQSASRADTILVFLPKTAPLYDTTQMAYSVQPREVAYYREREWGETPSQMFHPLIVRSLENTHAFGAVLTEPYSGRSTYTLRTEILQLIQEFTPDSAELVLSLRFQLTGSGAQAASTAEVTLREPLEAKNSSAGVRAANAATARALQQMVQQVLQWTESPP
jgi:cholesterol transport system auxiliary component